MPSMRLQGSSKEPTPKEKVGFNSSKSFEEPQKEASSIKRVGIDKSDTLSAGEGSFNIVSF